MLLSQKKVKSLVGITVIDAEKLVLDKSLAAIGKILNSTDEEFASRAFILDRVCEMGLGYNDWPLFAPWLNCRNPIEFGLQQIPSEFTDFCMAISKLGIETAVEVGVYHGASSYFIAAMLTRANRKLTYTMIDIADQLFHFEAFAKILPLRKAIPNTSLDFYGQSFDFVFIDGDHSFDGINRDWLNLGRFTNKAVAFHDINAHEFDHLAGGTVRFWKEFKTANARQMAIVEFAHSPEPWMGLGLAIKG
jgi:hypothetical protein